MLDTIEIDFDHIPEAVQKALKDSGLTETAFAENIGVAQPIINRLVRGEQEYPSILTLKKLWPFVGKYLVTMKGYA